MPKRLNAADLATKKERKALLSRQPKPAERTVVGPDGHYLTAEEVEAATFAPLDATHDFAVGTIIEREGDFTLKLAKIRKVRGMVVWLRQAIINEDPEEDETQTVKLQMGYHVDYLKNRGFKKHDEQSSDS